MGYLKFTADRIFTGFDWLGEDEVLITDCKGVIAAIVNAVDAGGDIQRFSGIISPGFINTHCHLELSHMKGRIQEHTGLVDFVWKIITERHSLTEDEIKQCIADAESEMIDNGIVAVGDICNNQLTIEQKQQNNLAYYNFIEASGFVPAGAQERFERARLLLKTFLFETDFANQTSIVPHAPYSVSDELWQFIQPYFDSKVVSIHNQETRHEDEFFKTGKGGFISLYDKMKVDHSFYKPTARSSLQSYYEKLQMASSRILVHNTFTGPEDLDFINSRTADAETYLCLCINANLYIEEAIPPVEKMMEYDCKIVMGTDSLASNKHLSILEEIKSLRKHFTAIPVEQMLSWATINGARALKMDEYLGSLERNKKPGVICISPGFEKVKRLV